MSGFIQPDLFIPAVVIPRGDGTFLVKPGKPVILDEEIDTTEAGKILGKSRHTIYRYIREGHLTAKQQTKRGHVRVFRKEVDALKARRHEAAE
jgi:excisionase family DNA binding protein